MLIAVGLVILAAALVVGFAGVLHNRGTVHSLGHPFTVLGHHIDGSSGALFLYGIVLGAIALAGLLLLLTGIRRTARRSRNTRRELREVRRENEAIARDRDKLAQAQAQPQIQAQPQLEPQIQPEPQLRPDPQLAPVPVPAHAQSVESAWSHSETPADISKKHSFFDPMPPPPGAPAHRAS